MAAARVYEHLMPKDADRPALAALCIALAKRDVAGIAALQRAHTQSACIQVQACFALNELLDESEEMRGAVVATGLLKPLLVALHAHPDVVEIMDLGLYTLIQLLTHAIAYSPLPDDLVATAIALGAVQIAVGALLAHTSHEGVAQNAT
jgi:hypothetical protein